METVTVTLNLSDEFLSDILVTAFDANYGGCWYWATMLPGPTFNIEGDDVLTSIWRSVKVIEQPELLHRDDPHPEYLVDHAVLARGIARILSGEAGITVDEVHGAVVEQDAGQIDANLADCIVQEGIFGKQVYG